jgi:Holliday junction resolvase RusA-like endonuclease
MTPSYPRGVETNGASIELLSPPPANNLFRNIRGKGRVISVRYARWRRDAGWQLQSQRPAKHKGPVAILIEVKAPDNRRRDIDGQTKALVDLLVAHQIIEGDDSRFVKEVSAKWIDHGEPRAVVTVRAAP